MPLLPKAYRITPFDERGDDHLEQALVVGHVQVRQDQARTNHQFDALQSIRHVRLKRLCTTRGKEEGFQSPANRIERVHGRPRHTIDPLVPGDPRGLTEHLSLEASQNT